MDTRKSVLEMTASEAKNFFLKPSSYVNIQLPRYFDFSTVITQADDLLSHDSLTDLSKNTKALSSTSDVNYNLLMNKDGLYDWRPLLVY
ncbi:hypothetical protein [Leuconostoc mesenteroides]|uniref:hypothetical protein n=1 Tax=Leuconostoc mesenteroides TaxID=1245 RepID=UPI0021A4AF2E|nr:hypothetical protein [Leuconostoc mesenteroides]MCT3045799.1 hypothetical protein [Leuconostoc mesenteroides]